MNKNSISLAGEFAVLSQLALRGYDANMTLGQTKSVDILASDPKNLKMYKLEVKTNHRNTRPQVSKIFGKIVSGWIMNKKIESIIDPDLFYCFVNIEKQSNTFKFYIVPSKVVAKYVKEEHQLYLDVKKQENKKVADTPIRMFRIGLKDEQYAIDTPTVEQYENNWEFNGR